MTIVQNFALLDQILSKPLAWYSSLYSCKWLVISIERTGLKSHCGRFEHLASLITPHGHSSLSCINEYLAIQTVVAMWTNSLRAIAAWLNASQRSWDGLGMNRSTSGWSLKRFEQSYGLDTVLYKNLHLNRLRGILNYSCKWLVFRHSYKCKGPKQSLWFHFKEIVEQVSTPFAKVCNLSVEEGIVLSEWKEANITFKKGLQTSLTSVVCNLLETLIRDHMVEFLVKHKLINAF